MVVLRMDKWASVPEMMRAVRLTVLRISGVLVFIALVGQDLGSAFGVAIGTALSLWQFSHLARSVAKSLQMAKAAAQLYAASNYVFRYLVIAALLALVYFSPGINFYAAIVGTLLVKVVIVGTTVVQALREGGSAYLRQLTARRGQKGGSSDG